MSYSFNLRAATKAEAKAAVAAQFDAAVLAQACHQRDRAPALAAADAYIDMLADDPQRDIVCSMNGSIGGTWSGTDVVSITGAGMCFNAALVAKL